MPKWSVLRDELDMDDTTVVVISNGRIVSLRPSDSLSIPAFKFLEAYESAERSLPLILESIDEEYVQPLLF